MNRFRQTLKEIAQQPRCKRHKWINDKQGRYCEKCGRREYSKTFLNRKRG